MATQRVSGLGLSEREGLIEREGEGKRERGRERERERVCFQEVEGVLKRAWMGMEWI
jgi:hypothetical protein